MGVFCVYGRVCGLYVCESQEVGGTFIGVNGLMVMSGAVNTTGSVRNTLLDSLLMEAAMTWELTANPRSPGAASSSIFTVAFSVDRKEPKFL
uniref:Uncharacterized protein n=1 Tax=Oncorhynchus mykiss TaxID=8022 RepID=A0A8K9UDG0_ONCMY